MNKETKAVFHQYCRDYDIDPRTLGMIAQHYLYLGEQVIHSLTPEDIKKTVEEERKNEKEAEENGHIYMISPDFTEYLLNAVVGLSKIDSAYRYKILKEMIV